MVRVCVPTLVRSVVHVAVYSLPSITNPLSSVTVLSYRDNINAGTATVIITNANGGNYIVNGTGTFVIAKGAASVVPDTVTFGLITSFGLMVTVTEPTVVLSSWLPSRQRVHGQLQR